MKKLEVPVDTRYLEKDYERLISGVVIWPGVIWWSLSLFTLYLFETVYSRYVKDAERTRECRIAWYCISKLFFSDRVFFVCIDLIILVICSGGFPEGVLIPVQQHTICHFLLHCACVASQIYQWWTRSLIIYSPNNFILNTVTLNCLELFS